MPACLGDWPWCYRPGGTCCDQVYGRQPAHGRGLGKGDGSRQLRGARFLPLNLPLLVLNSSCLPCCVARCSCPLAGTLPPDWGTQGYWWNSTLNNTQALEYL